MKGPLKYLAGIVAGAALSFNIATSEKSLAQISEISQLYLIEGASNVYLSHDGGSIDYSGEMIETQNYSDYFIQLQRDMVLGQGGQYENLNILFLEGNYDIIRRFDNDELYPLIIPKNSGVFGLGDVQWNILNEGFPGPFGWFYDRWVVLNDNSRLQNVEIINNRPFGAFPIIKADDVNDIYIGDIEINGGYNPLTLGVSLANNQGGYLERLVIENCGYGLQSLNSNAIVRDTVFDGNDINVRVLEPLSKTGNRSLAEDYENPDLGTEENAGNNAFSNPFFYDIVNLGDKSVMAQLNVFLEDNGDPKTLEERVIEGIRGNVEFVPFQYQEIPSEDFGEGELSEEIEREQEISRQDNLINEICPASILPKRQQGFLRQLRDHMPFNLVSIFYK